MQVVMMRLSGAPCSAASPASHLLVTHGSDERGDDRGTITRHELDGRGELRERRLHVVLGKVLDARHVEAVHAETQTVERDEGASSRVGAHVATRRVCAHKRELSDERERHRGRRASERRAWGRGGALVASPPHL